ncbi:hypothetical protein [Moraxella sp. ZY200743]|uniref:hypothetical protein n=1 Tax=Moraxella sp. ZY200743 TaxID=2911970 RepID=UPI003D7D168C
MQDNVKKSDAIHHSAQLLRNMFSSLNQAMSRETEKFHNEQKKVKEEINRGARITNHEISL